MIGTYEGEEYEIIEVPMKQVPSRQKHENKARATISEFPHHML